MCSDYCGIFPSLHTTRIETVSGGNLWFWKNISYDEVDKYNFKAGLFSEKSNQFLYVLRYFFLKLIFTFQYFIFAYKGYTFIYLKLYQQYALYNGLLHSGRLHSYFRSGVSTLLYIFSIAARVCSTCSTLINNANWV